MNMIIKIPRDQVEILDIKPIKEEPWDNNFNDCMKENVAIDESNTVDTVKNKISEAACDKGPKFLDVDEIKSFEKHALICHVCEAEYPDKPSLMLHIRSLHVKKENEKTETRSKTEGASACILDVGKEQKPFIADSQHLIKEGKKEAQKSKYSCDLVNVKKKIHRKVHNHSQYKNDTHNTLTCLCKRTFKRSGLIMHLAKVHVGWFLCNLCEKIFVSSKNIKKHCKDVHSQKVYTCSKCPNLYTSPAFLKTHSKICKMPEKFTADCDTCNKRIFTKGAMEIHLKNHMGVVYPCGECGQTFSHHKTMYRHRLIKHLGKLLCHSCEKPFSDRSDLDRHIRRAHKFVSKIKEKNEEYSCAICEKKFNRKDSLTDHIRCIHMNEGICKTCGRTFTTFNGLKKHINSMHQKHNVRIVKVLTLYTCAICNKKISSKRDLREHIDIKHYGQSYSCDICGRRYLSKKGYAVHKKEHEFGKLACVHCGKTFTTRWGLREHIESTHYGRSFTCDICGQFYSSRRGFTLHKKNHKLEKVSCAICEKTFKNKELITEHIRCIHPEVAG